MTTPLNDTPGSPDANTYSSLADAETYFADRIDYPPWSGADDPEKERALLTATRSMDDLFVWIGWVVNDEQALLFPRNGLTGRNDYEIRPEDGIPDEIREACAEFAGQLLASDRLSDSQIEDLQIRKIKAGSVGLEFGEGVTAKVAPDAVVNMIPRSWYAYIVGVPTGVSPLVRT